MTIITVPDTLHLGAECGWGQMTYDLTARGDAAGTVQARTLGPARWVLALRSTPAQRLATAGVWDALLASLRGSANILACWCPGRPAPVGTLRGTLTLASAAAQGASSVQVTGGAGQAGRTLLPGDLLGIGSGIGTSQLVMCASLVPLVADSTGTLTVPIEPPLRAGYASAVAVTWDKPRAYFRRASPGASSWTYQPGGPGGPIASGYSWDGLEVWSA